MKSNVQKRSIVTVADLAAALANVERPVVLLEGIRALPDADRAAVVALGQLLATRLPGVVFRSGNAEGTDTAFAEGVTAVDPARMEYVMTHAGMGRKRRHPGARAVALDGMQHVSVRAVGEFTLTASPDLKGLVDAYQTHGAKGPLGSKAAYLLRDTLKVIGAPDLGLAPATVGIFYANEADPLAGGTGHSIRVCRDRGVPVVLQSVWRAWLRT
ncbi:MAG: hypothetical protein H7831_16175 [Magnetococcus sp. WYHC-3]